MKPRIRWKYGAWECCLPNYRETRILGIGWSIFDAYKDWKRQSEAAVSAVQC